MVFKNKSLIEAKEENERLKKELETLKNIPDWEAIEKENEQLLKELNELKSNYKKLSEQPLAENDEEKKEINITTQDILKIFGGKD